MSGRARHVVDGPARRPAGQQVDAVDDRRQLALHDHRLRHVPDAQRQRRHVDTQHRVAAVSAVRHLALLKKVKFSRTRYRALGPELIPVYRQSARR